MPKTNSFIHESDSVEQQARDWLIHLQSGRATVQDAEDFRHWQAQSPQHEQAYEKARQLWHLLGVAANNTARRQQEEEPVIETLARRRISRRALLTGGAIAAAAAWLALDPPLQLWPGVNDFLADYRTGTGEQKQVRFNDHVVVEMNTQTRMNRLVLESSQQGIELLRGEAEFRTVAVAGATRESPLNLLVNHGWIQASDAVFNVRYLTDDVCLTCLEGQIRLKHPQGMAELTPGLQLVYNRQAIVSRQAADVQEVKDWRSGWLVFRNTPLAQAVEEINRYRPGKILLRNAGLMQRRVRGRFAIHALADFPAMIADSYGAGITYLPGGIVVLS